MGSGIRPSNGVTDKVLLLVEFEAISTLIHEDLIIERLAEQVLGIA